MMKDTSEDGPPVFTSFLHTIHAKLSLALPDPLRTGAYRLESLIDKRLCVEGLATRDYAKL